jgi:long-chain fatty acid transport protein
MRTRCRVAARLCAGVVTCPSLISAAHAGAFAIRDQSAYGEGAAFAGIAAGGSLSSMFWNPASLSDVKGFDIEAVGTGFIGTVDVDLDPDTGSGFSGSNEGNITRDALIPSGYLAYRVNDRVIFGTGINSPFGLVTKYDSDSILYQTGVAGTSKVFSLNVNPAIAVDVTDWLAVAVGLQVQYLDARLTRQSLGPLGISTLKGDDTGVGFTAGVKVVPLPGTEIGLGYRSAIDYDLDGTLQTQNAGTFDVKTHGVDLPDIVTLGIRQRITDRLRVMAGAEWENWSRFDTVAVEGGPAPVDLPFKYEDSWFLSVGGEYDLTPQIALRTGVGYEHSPIGDDERSYRLPTNNGLRLSVGGSYRYNDRFGLDLGYSFVTAQDMQIRAADDGGPAANGPFSGHADDHVHYISLALKAKL